MAVILYGTLQDLEPHAKSLVQPNNQLCVIGGKGRANIVYPSMTYGPEEKEATKDMNM